MIASVHICILCGVIFPRLSFCADADLCVSLCKFASFPPHMAVGNYCLCLFAFIFALGVSYFFFALGISFRTSVFQVD